MSKVLIAAYHPIVLKGLSGIIADKLPEAKIVATATHAKTFLSLLEIHKPEVAVVDVAITWKSEIDILDEIYKIHPTVQLHFVSTHPFDHSVQKYLINKIEQRVHQKDKDKFKVAYTNSEPLFKKKSMTD